VTDGMYILALDDFEEGCSLGALPCMGQQPLTSAYSALLLDFRRRKPCVVAVPFATGRWGHDGSATPWPFRAGASSVVYANLLLDDAQQPQQPHQQGGGTVAAIDFWHPAATGPCAHYQLPHRVDDFHLFGGDLYALCTEEGILQHTTRIYRCSRSEQALELCAIADQQTTLFDSPREKLKVFSICSRGFAVTYGRSLALGAIVEPPGPLCSPGALAERSRLLSL